MEPIGQDILEYLMLPVLIKIRNEKPGGNINISTPGGTVIVDDGFEVSGNATVTGNLLVDGTISGVAGTSGGIIESRSGGNGISFDWVTSGSPSKIQIYVEDVLVANLNSSATAKTFIIDHPDFKEEKYLIHTTLEGPENGVYYRGKSRLQKGKLTIHLPDYFNSLTKDGSATVILTPIGKKPFLLSYDNFNEQSFEVYGNLKEGEFSWEVKAERQDVPNLIVEPDKADVHVFGDGPYKYYVPKSKSNNGASVANSKNK